MKPTLQLPAFDVPPLPPKQLTPSALLTWLTVNYQQLRRSESFERIRDQATRRPSDAPFRLD